MHMAALLQKPALAELARSDAFRERADDGE
jgi:hypothetical protein